MSNISMSDREKALENRFVHDEELRFRAIARRNRLLGLWAAEIIGAEDPDGYAREVVAADFLEAGQEDVFNKIRRDFDAAKVSVGDAQIRERMIELLATATSEVEDR